MSITLSRTNQAEVLDLLRKLLQEVAFQHLSVDQRGAVIEHLSWLKAQKEISVSCRLETVPELALTKIGFDISPTPQGPRQ